MVPVTGIFSQARAHLRDVEAARGDVCAEQDPAGRLAELEKGGGALLLFLLPVDVHHRDVDVVEQLAVVLHL